MEFTWEKHQNVPQTYPLWFRQLEEIRHSGTPLSVEQLFLLAKTAHTADPNLKVFDWSIEQLKTVKFKTKKEESYFLYLMALHERSFNRLDEAKEWAKKSAEESVGLEFNPIARSLYALYLTELKKIHMGLEIFQEILSAPAPHLAQETAISNLVTFCIELGQTSALELYYEKAAPSTKLRCDLYRMILADDRKAILKMIDQCPIDPLINHIALVAVDLIAYVSLLNDEKIMEKLRGSWVSSYLKPHKNDPMFKRAYMLLEKPNQLLLTEEKSPSWYGQIRIYYLEMLLYLQHGDKNKASDILKNFLSPLAEELRINNPLIPHLSYGRIVPDSIIAQRISMILNGANLMQSKEKLQVSCNRISYIHKDEKIELDLSKSLKSITLLRVLAGAKGKAVTKEEIHCALSDIPYHPLEHDSRIHKLLDRLLKKLCDEGFPELWYKPGDNSIVLNYDIELN